jgi:hypothetical protein
MNKYLNLPDDLMEKKKKKSHIAKTIDVPLTKWVLEPYQGIKSQKISFLYLKGVP